MQSRYIHDGATIDHVAAADIKGGDVLVIGGLVAVAISDILDGERGTLRVEGLVRMPKGTGEITKGSAVYWDTDSLNDQATGTFAGWAAETSDGSTIDVLLASAKGAAADTVTATSITGDGATLAIAGKGSSGATAGGKVKVTGGAAAGSGSGGNAELDAGSSGSGTAGKVVIGATNASAVEIGKSGIGATLKGGLTLAVGASTTATSGGASLPAATGTVYPVKGVNEQATYTVKVNAADKVAGRVLVISETEGFALVLTDPDGDEIVGLDGNATATIVCLDATGDGGTWAVIGYASISE